MPNWCDNYISINANEELQEKIAEFVHSEESDFDFEKVIPMPENIYRGTLGSKEEKVYGKNNWRDWCLEHWGTEWNASVENAEPFEYWIKTAWTPCEPVIAELARLFPEAKIIHSYEDIEGGDFCGQNIYHAGKLVYRMWADCLYDWSAEFPETFDEEERAELRLEDDLYPLQNEGYICDTTADGYIHIREYKNGRLFKKVDGEFEDHRPEGERTYRW